MTEFTCIETEIIFNSLEYFRTINRIFDTEQETFKL